MAIWGKYRGKIEKVDSGNSAYLVGEYQMAFGRDWIIWNGKKSDEPGKEDNRNVKSLRQILMVGVAFYAFVELAFWAMGRFV